MNSRNNTNEHYTAALGILKGILDGPVDSSIPEEEAPPTTDDLIHILYSEMGSAYGEWNVSGYTEAGKRAGEESEKFRAMLQEMPELQKTVDRGYYEEPLWETIDNASHAVVAQYEYAAFTEGMRLGMRLMIDALNIPGMD